MHQGLNLGFWLGSAALALSLAPILLWRAERVLDTAWPAAEAQEVRLVRAQAVGSSRSVTAA